MQERVADLRGEMEGATGSVLHGLAGLLLQALNQLASAELSLAACEGTLPPPVDPKPITIGVDRIVCTSETSGPGSDEPYVLALAVDLASTVTVNTPVGPPVDVPFRSLHVTRVGPWEDVDDDETHPAAELNQPDRRALWSLSGNLQLTDPTKTVILAALMENDDADPEGVRTTIKSIEHSDRQPEFEPDARP